MNLWRLEILRLLRTRFWLALFTPFLVFGLLGPVMAYYLSDILSSASTNITIIVAEAQPMDGFSNYINNAFQIGLLVAIIIGASALAIDTNPSLSIFYRSRAGLNPARLILPRYGIVSLATILAFDLGILACWYQTNILLGSVEWQDILIGTLLINLYLGYSLSVLSLSTTLVKSTKASVGISLIILLSMPILGMIKQVSDWLPSSLVGSLVSIASDKSTPSDYYPASLVAIVLIPILLWTSVTLFKKRSI
ncbi:hypothetical protein KA531_00730 [Candidatus Saccharibacteria bacterium]|nr:hypothetical protein [Candidatus Saccharibacteria bacterium]